MLSLVGYGEGMSSVVNGDWRRLGDYVVAARERLGMTSRAQLAAAAGVAEGTVQRLETGNLTRLPNRIGAIERALGKAPGWARRVAEGIEAEVMLSGEGTLSAAPAPAMTQAEKDKFRELVLRSKMLSPAVRDQILAEVAEAPVVTSDDDQA